MIIKQLIRVGLIALCVVAAPLAAQAQPAVTPAPTSSSFDGYRALAITAGVVAGAMVAAIITDGLIIPVLAATTSTGAEAGAVAGATTMAGAAGTGAAAAAPAAAGTGAAGAAHAGMMHAAGYGYGLLHGTMRLLGAVSGGLYADTLYLNR